MRVWLAHPRFRRSCQTCMAHQFDENGNVERDPSNGDILRRIPDTPTPCESCPKCPPWAKALGMAPEELREHAADLTPQNREALDYYFRMKAVGWPEPAQSDPVCQWYAGIIRQAEDDNAADLAGSTNAAVVPMIELLLTRMR